MASDASSPNFEMSYTAEEDRLLISSEAAPGEAYAMTMTRRLTRRLIGALAEMEAKRRAPALGQNQLLRDTILSFEHAQAVAEGLSAGDTKVRRQRKPLAASPPLIRTITLTPRPDGIVRIALHDRQRVLSIEMTSQRVHSFIAALLDLADKAGWDLPVIATWLDRADDDAADTAPKAMH